MRYFTSVSLLFLLMLGGSLKAAELSPSALKEGKKLYLSKCAKCHEFYPPADYSKRDWDAWMVKMRKKSKLKAEQFDLVERYVATLRHDDDSAKNQMLKK